MIIINNYSMKKLLIILSLLWTSFTINVYWYNSCAWYLDVTKEDWFCNHLVELQDNKIIKKQEYFRPSAKVNRAEALKVIYELSWKVVDKYNINLFEIKSDIWYQKYVYSAYGSKYIFPNNNVFSSSEYISKAEFAVLIMKILEVDHNNVSCNFLNTVRQKITSNWVEKSNFNNYLCLAQDLNIVTKDLDSKYIDRAVMSRIVYNILFNK